VGREKQRNIRGILFDVGGVFHVPRDDPPREKAFIRKVLCILKKAGVYFPRDVKGGTEAEALKQMIQNGRPEYKNYAVGTGRELAPERIWAEYFLRPLGISPKQIAPFGETLCRLYEERQRLIPRRFLRRTIKTLHQWGFRQGVVSNTTAASFTYKRLNRYRIAPFMETVKLSCLTGIRKPDPAIFHAALRELGLEAEECVYVGDQISRDLAGGRNAGMGRVILFRPGSGETGEAAFGCESRRPDLYPDRYIGNFRELLVYMHSFAAGSATIL
jgi:putative hydrolase of the HAD superfamily